MPTGGVDATEESIQTWFKAGVTCVGIGSALIRKDWVAEGNFAAVSEKNAAGVGLDSGGTVMTHEGAKENIA